MNTQAQQLFTLLFIHGEPLSLSEIFSLLNIGEDTLQTLISEINEYIAVLPISLIQTREGLSLVTKPEQGEFLKHIKTKMVQTPLSKAALETLTLIVYNNGASKAFIDSVRGVNSALSLRNLVMRGLVEKVSDEQGVSYKTTSETLLHLGITHVSELPDYELFQHEREQWSIVDSQ